MSKKIIGKLQEDTQNRLEILLINERYYQRKTVVDNNYQSILGNVQNEIKNCKDYLEFLNEIKQEK